MKIVANKEKRGKNLFFIFTFAVIGIVQITIGQRPNSSDNRYEVSKLFQSEEVLPLRLSYSNKEIRTYTNDSTYIPTELSYRQEDGSWDTLDIQLRGRGNFRRNNCYFPPLKLKIAQSVSAGTLFEGNKKLKLVLPCFNCNDNNDNVLKEYIAYKLYEEVSPYHFKTRLVSIDFTEIRGAKTRKHQLLGILIENIKKVAKRHKGNVIKRNMSALAQEATTSVRNDLFNFMIGNTDYSTTYQHNQKLLFVDKKLMPVPYDFDMSGLVDSHYAVVSNVQNLKLNISEVTERMYKGYARDTEVYEQVRTEFIRNKEKVLKIVDRYQSYFDNHREFATAKKYLISFYDIVENDNRFDKNVLALMRS